MTGYSLIRITSSDNADFILQKLQKAGLTNLTREVKNTIGRIAKDTIEEAAEVALTAARRKVPRDTGELADEHTTYKITGAGRSPQAEIYIDNRLHFGRKSFSDTKASTLADILNTGKYKTEGWADKADGEIIKAVRAHLRSVSRNLQ